jgi:hypothetical protein
LENVLKYPGNENDVGVSLPSLEQAVPRSPLPGFPETPEMNDTPLEPQESPEVISSVLNIL